ncbi:hypothetical protein HCG51_22125 [Tolypothrix sp. PCC 7910]|uniref:hypothetical protein n=1 Tax=Tolypothrix sp. PCC 7910 TaxID=2099387 RepID=UPI00142787EE|nr:hypothetical protein [Tolypothrix sp. PCC 7910]QIR39140.1 hypothetical protein HCG51_22125 [Tolypothrix sp. PCC 7910]
MFLTSSNKPIDDSLKNLAEEITTQNSHLSVLFARQLRYALQQTNVELTITEARPLNILEEFIIRAGIEFDPPPTAKELASILGLDIIFVESKIKTLQRLQTLAPKSPITVTEQGRLFYEKGSVPQPPYAAQVYAITDALSNNIIFQSEPLSEINLNLPNLANFLNVNLPNQEIFSLTLEQIQTSLQASEVALHVPEAGKIVTAFRVLQNPQIIWRKISIFVVYDANQDKISIQLQRGKEILDSSSQWLDTLLSEGKISLAEVCKSLNTASNFEIEATLNHKNKEIESRFNKIRQQALESNIKPSTKSQKSSGSGNVIQLRERHINQTFLEILNAAKFQIIIYSPLVNQVIANKEILEVLEQAAKRGVSILIGYGISPQTEIPETIQAIKIPEGLPYIQLAELADSHIKEVIVDREIYLCSSYQWLDYSGEQIPLGDSVYHVTISQQVNEAYEFLTQRFHNHAQQLWIKALENRDTQLARDSLYLWSAMGMENIALNEIEKNNWLELLPVWLNIFLPRLNAKNLSDDLVSFKLALSLLSQVTLEAPFIDSLQQGLRQFINAIATHNRDTAVNLLNNEVWSELLRLQIAQENDSVDDFISQQTLPQQPSKKEPATKIKKVPTEKKTRKKVKE